MAEACAGARHGAGRHLPRLLDRRQLLHLDRPRRRPDGLEPAGGRAGGARRGDGRAVGRCRGAGRSARRDPDRRRQRLVLVVRRRPFVGPRPRVRRPVPASPAERLPAAAMCRCPDELFVSNISTAAAPPVPDRADGPDCADPRRRGDQLLRVAWRRRCSRSARSPARCTRPTAGRRRSTLIQFGFDGDRLYVRVDVGRPGPRSAGRRARALAEVRRPRPGSGSRSGSRRPGHRRPSGIDATPSRTGSNAARAAPPWRPGTILELAMPLADLGLSAGDEPWRSSRRSTTRAAPSSSAIRRIGRLSSPCRTRGSKRGTGASEFGRTPARKPPQTMHRACFSRQIHRV